ncbi:precorrin-6y C5,15-methyltransferase (decarboxylating) subunit CbiE [Blastococcus deserti]|uniref:Precorrin-6y C5,15-methyltransferase (Decarboxylating) subunit CbiE n=1 Tax=Blastococcus deserti TaxID=2259033 RepID=A0ABW4XFE3_9ACTN
MHAADLGGAPAALSPPVVVVGLGADGWDGLAPRSRAEIEAAEVLIGSARQLHLVPVSVAAERVPWPSPLSEALPGLVEQAGRAVVVLASGDPMLSGIGTTLTRLLGADRVRVLPAPSSVSLACARLGWAVEDTAVVTLVGRPVELLHPHVQPGRRLLVLGSDGGTPAQVAALLARRGYGASVVTVLGDLGAPDETRHAGTAAGWSAAVPALAVTAVECRADPGTVPLPTVPGLPDEAYESDGQLTKSDVRAVTLARLAPVPGGLLWDVGAGSGSIGIEWMRTHPSSRAVAVEASAERAGRITRNAARLGVPYLQVVVGRAPEALQGLARPDAVFIGGGLTTPGLPEACWEALPPGGRLVANAVTVESEAVLAAWFARAGGDLLRLGIQHAEPVGRFTGWKPAMPVTIWTVVKP